MTLKGNAKMKILIVEDEELAVKKLQKTLLSIDRMVEVVGVTDSIKSTVRQTLGRRNKIARRIVDQNIYLPAFFYCKLKCSFYFFIISHVANYRDAHAVRLLR